jgi:hypoxia-inducible factor 1 alpha
VNCSGIENEHEILSCAQLEAQQELSSVDANALGAIKKCATEKTDTKVTKRDNIVLGLSDLKQKKVVGQTAAGAGVTKCVVNISAGEQIAITPINTIKVNNCEIVDRRPRSVTAAIFAHPSFTSAEQKAQIDSKSRAQSATAKIFRSNPQNVTSSIFAPRTEDMNKGFLMFSEDESGLTSK